MERDLKGKRMQIEEQIKALQRVKAKIDLYKKVISNIEIEKDSEDPESKTLEKEHPGLIAEFCDEITVFCSKRVEMLGNPQKASMAPPIPREPVEPELLEKTDKPKKPEPPVEAEPRDPLKFLLKYKYLDGKTVSFRTKDGKITGKVRGLVVPNIRVETDSGYDVDVPPKELTVEG